MSAESVSRSVNAWEQDVVLPTYPAQAPDANPMFLEKRVYQGSSGKVYPNPFTDRVATEKIEKTYRAVMLENEYVRLMILPEIGGRIHFGLDKTNQYDFFYRQNVIKPALVGLLGPWISGGVEFNWPQHHRPSTYMPVHYRIESSEDGSQTVWLSEHEPMNRLKGMVGICLRPGKSIIEAKVQLYNRTPLPQSFLWWANVGVRVHDEYQAFFPPDVTFVADHAKRALTSFPIARGFYYGVDYRQGVDISWYKNIPVPTSYMVTHSKYDFCGGYDFARRAGFVHCSNHHIAPGKKLWTWGNGDFGHAWDRNLTDADGPYIELMAGGYTDNQPDFSWLQPYETKTFSQFWYPIQEIGPAKNANRRVALNVTWDAATVRLGVCTSGQESVRVLMTRGGAMLYEKVAAIEPGKPLIAQLPHETGRGEDLRVAIFDQEGSLLLEWEPETPTSSELPEPATDPGDPTSISTNEELYLIGLHLEQYRHATRDPAIYWREGLRRDFSDARINNAMGRISLRRGEFSEAEAYFRAAIERLTFKNPNPYDGECYYNLGLALQFRDQIDAAYDAFYKAVWNYAWRSAGYYALACIDAKRRKYEQALDHIENSLLTNTNNLKARGLKAALLRRIGRPEEARVMVELTLAIDPLDLRSAVENFLLDHDVSAASYKLEAAFESDVQSVLDISYDYAQEGLIDDAVCLLEFFATGRSQHPMVLYTLAWLLGKRGDAELASRHSYIAATAPSLYCFPFRLQEMLVLESICSTYPDDAKAACYLGNLYYDKLRYEDAIRSWRRSVTADDTYSIPWRNLGISEFNVRQNPRAALECYAKAFAANSSDARLLYEWDQLKKRVGVLPEDRLLLLEAHPDLVAFRDDLSVEFITLLNQTGKTHLALERLLSNRFSPWEGGEGLVSSQYAYAHVSMGRAALEQSDTASALEHFQAARLYPQNLGEGKHLLLLERDIDYYTGLAHEQLQQSEAARGAYESAGAPIENPIVGPSRQNYFRAMALLRLGREDEATYVLKELLSFAETQRQKEQHVDYFATSLPNFLLFEDDLQKQNEVLCSYLSGLAELGLGNHQSAISHLLRVLDLDPSHALAREELRYLAATDEVPLAPAARVLHD